MTGRALITGAARRLGAAMALDLAEAGWDVAIHYHGSGDAAEETRAACAAHGVTAVALRADLLDERETSELVGRAVDGLGGPLTLLINNASIFENDGFGTMTRESWDRAMLSNLRAPVRLTQVFAAQAPEAVTDARGEPRAQAAVVNMLDQRILNPHPSFLSYAIAKNGLMAFTVQAAMSLAPHVRVNGIGPGPTLRADRQSEESFTRQRNSTVLRRGANPEDIVGALRYLIAAPAVTGQMIAVDGGEHLTWAGASFADQS